MLCFQRKYALNTFLVSFPVWFRQAYKCTLFIVWSRIFEIKAVEIVLTQLLMNYYFEPGVIIL